MKLFYFLAWLLNSLKILYIGTLCCYSTIWMARALPKDGRLITLEFQEKHAQIARTNIDRAGLSNIVELRVGRALETLPRIEAEGKGPFDLVFVDADKKNNPEYFEWALRLSRRGSIVVVDNVVRKGGVVDAASKDEDIKATRKFLEMLATETRVCATAVQTVGSKGYDGFAIVLVTAESHQVFQA